VSRADSWAGIFNKKEHGKVGTPESIILDYIYDGNIVKWYIVMYSRSHANNVEAHQLCGCACLSIFCVVILLLTGTMIALEICITKFDVFSVQKNLMPCETSCTVCSHTQFKCMLAVLCRDVNLQAGGNGMASRA